MEKDNIIATGQQETRLFQDACKIIEQAQESAYRQVNDTYGMFAAVRLQVGERG